MKELTTYFEGLFDIDDDTIGISEGQVFFGMLTVSSIFGDIVIFKSKERELELNQDRIDDLSVAVRGTKLKVFVMDCDTILRIEGSAVDFHGLTFRTNFSKWFVDSGKASKSYSLKNGRVECSWFVINAKHNKIKFIGFEVNPSTNFNFVSYEDFPTLDRSSFITTHNVNILREQDKVSWDDIERMKQTPFDKLLKHFNLAQNNLRFAFFLLKFENHRIKFKHDGKVIETI